MDDRSLSKKSGHVSRLRKGVSYSLVLVFLFFLSIPCFPQAVPEEGTIPSLEQAELLFSAGRYGDAIRMLDGLEENIEAPADQVTLYLLKARSYLALGNRAGCEDAVRDIYSRELSDRIEEDTLEEELRVVFSTVKAEYWFSLNKPKVDEDDEKIYQQVIEQAKQKPKKKSLLPKLVLGTVLAVVLAGGIYLIASGNEENIGNGNTGTLKFENGMVWEVTIEVGELIKVIPGNRSYFGRPAVNIVYIDLPAGDYSLKVTSTSTFSGITTVYFYDISINLGQETYFLFRPE